MGFAVVHMMKIGKGGVRGIQSHNQREKESRNNPDIDKTRSNQNYDVLNQGNINYNRAVKERIEVFATKTATVRKDAVVMCNFVVTSDEQTMKAMSPERQKEFFNDSTEFFMKRYGGENVVNATVHMDEKTPHMHLGVVPITNDGRLACKSIFTRKELTSLQTDFAREVGLKYGLERGKEGSERTHLSEQRFKLETAKAQTQELSEKTRLLREGYEASKKKYDIAKEEVESRLETLENMSSDLSKVEDHMKGAIGKLDKIEAKKIPFTDKYSISAQDYSTLRALAETGKNKALENLQLKTKVESLEREINSTLKQKSYEEHIKDIKLERLEKLEGIREKYEDLDKSFKRVEKAINNLDLVDKVNNEIEAIRGAEKALNKSPHRGR
ncbi:MAG: MobV family relaxase [Ignavibacteriaceae bacterium]|nr:MobV family relaxase [Ignavibacteriaceae bacterium]